jgi:hypothetical protein
MQSWMVPFYLEAVGIDSPANGGAPTHENVGVATHSSPQLCIVPTGQHFTGHSDNEQ